MIRLRLQELRDARGWSQAELAKRSGVRQATISDAEAGKGVSLATLEKLADGLDVNASYLIVHEREKKAAKAKR